MPKHNNAWAKMLLFFSFIADILFPKPKSVKNLENMSAGEIAKKLQPAEEIGNISGVKKAVALFKYSHDMTKTLVWEIKYRGNTQLAAAVGELLGEKILEIVGECGGPEHSSEILLIPIPSSPRSIKERGFSQTELIAEKIMAAHSLKFSYNKNILVKIKNTPTQASLEAKEARLKNLVGAFAVKIPKENLQINPEVIAGKHIILIDDVITTGSTIAEATRALAAAQEIAGDSRSGKIFALSIAH